MRIRHGLNQRPDLAGAERLRDIFSLRRIGEFSDEGTGIHKPVGMEFLVAPFRLTVAIEGKEVHLPEQSFAVGLDFVQGFGCFNRLGDRIADDSLTLRTEFDVGLLQGVKGTRGQIRQRR